MSGSAENRRSITCHPWDGAETGYLAPGPAEEDTLESFRTVPFDGPDAEC